jgi:hypothetical protein
MTFEHKPNRGSIFKAAQKLKADDRDFTGSALIEGKGYWVSGWRAKSKDGRQYLNLSFKPKDAAPATARSRTSYVDDFGIERDPF